MNNIFDALEVSLQELEDGTDLEVVLGHFPDFADELRPILETSIKARGMAVPAPSADVVRRGRAKVMQHAAELREAKVKPRKQGIPMFQRFAISLGLAALFLTSGTGLVNASSTALPGERLYPVKRTWEDVRLLFIFDEHERNLLKYEFEDERLNEVNELMSEGRHEAIQIAGVFMQSNGKTYVSGIQVIVPSNISLPDNGTSVLLTGITNADGFVEAISLEILPDGSVVPLGNPIEVEVEADDEGETTTPPPVNEPVLPEVKYFAMEGILQVINSTSLVVNDVTVLLDKPKIDGELCVGIRVELKGYFTGNGTFMVTQIESEGRCVSPSPVNENNNSNNSNSNSNTNTGTTTNTNSNNSNDDSNTNDDDHEDNSGSGSGNSGSGSGSNDNDEPDDD